MNDLLAAIDRRRACRYGARLVGDMAAAEDMVQEACLRVMRHAGRYQDRGRFVAYYYRVLTNVCLNEIERRRRRGEGSEVGSAAAPPAVPADDLVRRELKDLVVRLLARLPSRQMVAVILKEHEGLSYREIGGLLAVSESNAATLVYRGLKGLRAMLRPEDVA